MSVKLTEEDHEILSELPQSEVERVLGLIDDWLDDQMSSFEPIVQGALALAGESPPDTDDPIVSEEYFNRLLAMRTFVTSTGATSYSRNTEGFLAQLVKFARPVVS